MPGARNLIARIEIEVTEETQPTTVLTLDLDHKISALANLDGTREHSAAKGSLKVGKRVSAMASPAPRRNDQ